MEQLGPSLDKLFNKNGHKFSHFCVLNMAIQLIDCIEAIHKNGIIHRDIKPHNFCIKNKNDIKNCQNIVLIDFDLSTEYRNQNGTHIEQTIDLAKNLVGTPYYTTINTHNGILQSRRDDLEMLGYSLLFMQLGGCVWTNDENVMLAKKQRFKGWINKLPPRKQGSVFQYLNIVSRVDS